MIEAIIAIKSPEWINKLTGKYYAHIRVLSCIPFAAGWVKDLIEISAPETSLKEAVEELKSSNKFQDVDVAQTGKTRALASISTNRCSMCQTLAGSESFLINASTKKNRIYWTLLTSTKKPLKKIMKILELNGFEVEIIKMAMIKGRKELTGRQEEIIRIALDKGYFDCPKKTSIRELSRMFGISKSTLSEVLRLGQKKIIKSYFKG
jgi:predicted DNA binding protein|tara:strand:- start:2287 stop:2907 length:621 start_codon:yes stop_codon:yes gene_type:complete